MTKTKYIITDIEGTTTSISFVYDVLFPYFRDNIEMLNDMLDNEIVKQSISDTQALIKHESGQNINIRESIQQLKEWSLEDKKVGPLKSIQGVLWEKGYNNGEIKGHVYDDVPIKLQEWKNNGINLGVYSSGSVKAQKLLFGHSIFGDLNPVFSFNFDLNIGQKREGSSYRKIAETLNTKPDTILFLSDIVEELDAAKSAGLKTIQLVRPGTIACTNHTTVYSFSEINL